MMRRFNVTGNVIKLNLRQNLSSNDVCFSESSMVSSGLSPAFIELKFLRYLNLAGIDFNGSQIPEFIGSMRYLRHLNLSQAGFAGPVPPQLGNLTHLKVLDLHVPFLCIGLGGLYAQSLGWASGLSKLQFLDMGSCIMSEAHDTFQVLGSLPQHIVCVGCNLWLLDLHNNSLTGSIPHWLSHLETINVIILSANKLSGAIFEGGNASSLLTGKNVLDVLDLDDNMLSGEIQVGDVYPDASLRILSLRGNNFTGPIRSQLCQFRSLRVLELAQNSLTGQIPDCLGSMQFDSDAGGLISRKGVEIAEIIKGITEMVAGTEGTHSLIDLSSNHLVGTIPEELTSISKLEGLNLSNNHLTGVIPAQIGNLMMLESLDLSNNQLSGIIPQSLSAIPWIVSLNLSNNNLRGPIPTGNQLQTLIDPSIYAGNPGLCGPPLSNKCRNVPPSTAEDEPEHDKRENIWFYTVVILGVGTGFWVVVGTLVIKKSWRHAYFRFVEETAVKIQQQFKSGMNGLRRRL